MNYRLTNDINLIRKIADGQADLWIPNDPDNKDWVEYQAWLALGNEPDPAD